MSTRSYSLGLDFGTSSARALVANTWDGSAAGVGVASYRHGVEGVITDPSDPNLARQHPLDWLEALEQAVRSALAQAAASDTSFSPQAIVGIGIDATASTPLAVDSNVRPLALDPRFQGDPAALAWLWKDHTAHAEAEAITRTAAHLRPEYLTTCGGAYSSEWFFSKLLRALRTSPRLLEAAAAWLEEGDYIAAALTGAPSPAQVLRGACAAGHKALYNPAWGFPDLEFLAAAAPELGAWCRGKLPDRAHPSDVPAGRLCAEWAERLGLPRGLPVAVAGIDAHVGAVGAGARPGSLVKILGTSGCDLLVHPLDQAPGDIPGICGVAAGSILPGHHGLEAGQSALGDLFGWFVREIGKPAGLDHEDLAREASRLAAGESGLLALDWHNGNRSILADPRLTGLLVGLSLATRPAEIYRALLEATAYGSRIILERFEEHGVSVREIIVTGGIAEKNPLLLQILADVTGRTIERCRPGETCALGAAIFGAVVGKAWRSVEEASRAMVQPAETSYRPHAAERETHERLFTLYRKLHNAFGLPRAGEPLFDVMKDLLAIREGVRKLKARGASLQVK